MKRVPMRGARLDCRLCPLTKGIAGAWAVLRLIVRPVDASLGLVHHASVGSRGWAGLLQGVGV